MTNSIPLKQRIHAGEQLLGVTVPITSTQSELETILGKDDYDFVWIDSQHGPLNEERLVAFCGMAEGMGLHVQLRIKHTRHTYLIGNLLDLGPTGVEVPQVEKDATVDEAVANFLYPQAGVRSWGGSARYGLANYPDPQDYIDLVEQHRRTVDADRVDPCRCPRQALRQAGRRLSVLGTDGPASQPRSPSAPSVPDRR